MISICYNIGRGSVEKLKKNGADLILAPFNDTGFGAFYHNIQRYYPIINAVEYGVPVVVVNEDGISQIIDDKGCILGKLGYGKKDRLDRLVTIKIGNNPYSLYGGYLEWFVFLGLILFIFYNRYKNTNKKYK